MSQIDHEHRNVASSSAAAATGREPVADSSPHVFLYEACDIPAGMTIRDYQLQQASCRSRRKRTARLRQLAARSTRGLRDAA